MKYIDADELIAEIEGRIKLNQMMLEKDSRPSDYGRIEEGRYILRFVERIQQEQQEVDLEKEYKSYMEQRRDDLSGVAVTINMKDLARHFFELGLSAGMEKSNGVDGVVHHALKSHWIVTDKNKLAAILKAFPEGAEVELFICAKKEKNDK